MKLFTTKQDRVYVEKVKDPQSVELCFRLSFCFPAGCPGEPTVCGQDSASVTLVGCLLAEKGINYTNLHLNDPNCTGLIEEENKTVTFSFNSSNTCGAVITVGFRALLQFEITVLVWPEL